MTWAFSVQPSGGGSTLLVRARTDYRPDWIQPFHALLAAPLHGFMEGRQLSNVKHRVESSR